MKRVIILGAGKKGLKILRKMGRNIVAFFVDNDKNKQGGVIEGIEIISFEKLIEIHDGYDVILSFYSSELIEQLEKNMISYWNNEISENCYFNREDIREEIDKRLLWRYWNDTELKDRAYVTESENWYRKEYCSVENEQLVKMMKGNQTEEILSFLNSIYSSGEVFEDEYYESRPGMRLVRNILHAKENDLEMNVLDLGCGHGELISMLKKEGFKVCGVDQSIERIRSLQKAGINCFCANIEDEFVCEDKFDVIICQECLEHVVNPIRVLKKIYELLKSDGTVFITVPYGKNCDYVTHVRQFDESKIYSILIETGFIVNNIIQIPYLNYTSDICLFAGAKKL